MNQTKLITSHYQYNVYEAPIEIIREKLDEKKAKIDVALKELNIVEYDNNDVQKTYDFVNVFNEIALTSTDPYEQLNSEIIKEHFSQGSFLAYRFGKVVGYVILSFSQGKKGKIAAIAGVGIHHKARGRGLSTAFLKYIVDWITDKKEYTWLEADILTSNDVSIGLFTSLGFKKVDEFFLY